MDGVGIPIIERPRPLPGHDTPNPTQHPYTLKCEEPLHQFNGHNAGLRKHALEIFFSVFVGAPLDA